MQHISSTKQELLESLGSLIVDCSAKATQAGGQFTVAFSGGSAATNVCECMKIEKFSKAVDWSKWNIFFCDERFVDLTHPDSNYKAINDGLIENIKEINRSKVFTLNKTGNVSDAASAYEKALHGVFKNVDLPRFDLVILGMGPDGHICSLFPNHALLDEKTKWVASLEDSPKPPPGRITFTLDVVNNAKDIVFITTGASKAEPIQRAIENVPNKEIPASLVRPVNGNLHWFMDTDSSSLLKSTTGK